LSLGEYTALCFSGCFNFEDGVKLTKARGEAMQSASLLKNSGMVAIVGTTAQNVRELVLEVNQRRPQSLWIANYLAEDSYTVAGSVESCALAKKLARSFGTKAAVTLPVSGAFHTRYMLPSVETLGKAVDHISFSVPKIPVVSNLSATIHDAASIKPNLLRQVCEPVLWKECIDTILRSVCLPANLEASSPVFYEIGPGTVCKNLLKRRSSFPFEVINVI
jgi:[acyl-carrier-protein] S-malonyltransferase